MRAVVCDDACVRHENVVCFTAPIVSNARGSIRQPRYQSGDKQALRIEDDVAVTRGAPEVLTGALVKDADGIEAFIAAARR